jgi:hypothetical protein
LMRGSTSYKRRRREETQRRPCEGRQSLEWCNHKDSVCHQKLKKARDRLSPRPFGRAQPCWHLDFGLLVSRAVRE